MAALRPGESIWRNAHTVSYLAVVVWLSLVGLVIFYPSLGGFWRWDDPNILLHLQANDLFDEFASPSVWQSFSSSNLTPWLILSFELDLFLFGLNPAAFYGHQLLVIVLCGVGLFHLLNLWTDNTYALLGSTLFLVGVPPMMLAHQLMARHYVDGMFLSLLALIFFVRFLRHERPHLLFFAVLCYACATTAKEVYVPLMALLPFIPEGQIRKRLLSIIPFALTALLYILWRQYMLGTLVGGYEQQTDYLSLAFIQDVVRTLANLPALLLGTFWPLFVALYGVMLLAFLLVSRRSLVLFLLVFALIVGPLIPLVRVPGILEADRYLFTTWTAVCFSLALFGNVVSRDVLRSRKNSVIVGSVLFFLLITFTASFNFSKQRQIAVIANTFDAEGAFIWENDNKVGFIPPKDDYNYLYLSALKAFKAAYMPGAVSPALLPDQYFAENILDIEPAEVFVLDRDCNCLRNVDSYDAPVQDFDLTVDQTAPLSVETQVSDNYFEWRFGPYTDGIYQFVSEDLGIATLTQAGRIGAPLENGSVFYVRYQSPQGWVTYSDPIPIRLGEPVSRWER